MQNKSFDASGLQFAWDSTSIKLAEECLMHYKLKMLDGWASRGRSVHLRFGGLYASALEHYHKHLVQGFTPDNALLLIVQEAMIESWDHECDENGIRIEGTGSAWDPNHNTKTRENLIRTIVWYVDHFADDPLHVARMPDGSPAVECSIALPVDDGIVFTGHFDRVVEYGSDVLVMDQKAQPVTTKVLCENGWRMIGSLAVGDRVYGANGTLTDVIGIYPKGITDVFRVHFNDGTSVRCGKDHLWTVRCNTFDGERTLNVTDLLDMNAQKRYSVPLVQPVQHPDAVLPVDPYVLGALLGDGYLNGGSIQLSSSKPALVDKVASHLGSDIIRKNPAENYTWTISGGKTLAGIRALGLKGTKSRTKFIPDSYLFASESQRRDLLAGLLDTDGSWNGRSRIYDSMSLLLIEGVCALVRSLGGQARYRDRGDGAYRASLRMPEWPAGVGRRIITKIEPDSRDETVCIKVAASDGLYVTENYTVTHNTSGSTISSHYFAAFEPDVQMSMYTFLGRAALKVPVSGVIIDAAQIAVGFTRFERGMTFRTTTQLDEWYDYTMHTIERARKATREQYFPMNRTACGNYGGCEFRKICSKSPEHRESFLRGDYERAERWTPSNVDKGINNANT